MDSLVAKLPKINSTERYIVFFIKMARATVEGVIEEVAEEMACLERALPPPIGVELTPEANGMGPRAQRRSVACTDEKGGGGESG